MLAATRISGGLRWCSSAQSALPCAVTPTPIPNPPFTHRLALGAQWQVPLCEAHIVEGPEQPVCAKSSAIQDNLSLLRLKSEAEGSGLATYILTALLVKVGLHTGRMELLKCDDVNNQNLCPP